MAAASAQSVTLVDPFLGSEPAFPTLQDSLVGAWSQPKPPIGNTHPGACSPLGMVSVCPFSGAYPTGYGRFDAALDRVGDEIHQKNLASGFAHFQQSGTGAIRKYYNYFRVTPMLGPLDELGTLWELDAEQASPGFYSASLLDHEREARIGAEVTVGPKSAVHRYHFPAHDDARVVIDFSQGGLAIEHGLTIPQRASIQLLGPGIAQGMIIAEGVEIAVRIEFDQRGWKQILWYDRRLIEGSSSLEFDAIRETTLRPFGLVLLGSTGNEESVEIKLGFSLRGQKQARANLAADCSKGGFDERRSRTASSWQSLFDQVRVEPAEPSDQTMFWTALYHSFIKPCFAPDESPFWNDQEDFAFDIATMWNIYKTQLPLLTLLQRSRAEQLAHSLLSVVASEGNLPIGYRMARGSDRFYNQGSALAHTFLADLCALGVESIDWEEALMHMYSDLRRGYGEDFLEGHLAHPLNHTLDLAYGYSCTARVARHVEDRELTRRFEQRAQAWVEAFDPSTGLVRDSGYAEGGRWNYSFRLMHDMATRIDLSGGEANFTALLDEFFGLSSDDSTRDRPGGIAHERDDPTAARSPSRTQDHKQRLPPTTRFTGLNAETDMETPWAYYYCGHPERTADIVHFVRTRRFTTGRGGLPGNDDSGSLSSWFVWANLGLFPVAGQSMFLVGVPAFHRASIRTSSGEYLDIERLGRRRAGADRPSYVQSVRFNGRDLERSWLSASEVHSGGVIEIDVGDDPAAWRPPPPPSNDSAG